MADPLPLCPHCGRSDTVVHVPTTVAQDPSRQNPLTAALADTYPQTTPQSPPGETEWGCVVLFGVLALLLWWLTLLLNWLLGIDAAVLRGAPWWFGFALMVPVAAFPAFDMLRTQGRLHAQLLEVRKRWGHLHYCQTDGLVFLPGVPHTKPLADSRFLLFDEPTREIDPDREPGRLQDRADAGGSEMGGGW